MTGHLSYEANPGRLDQMRRRAEQRLEAIRARASRPRTTRTEDQMQRIDFITIRRAGEADRALLERLATLDSRPLPSGEVLIAEVGDEPRAAIEVASGAIVADPFRPTADLVVLLRVRASRVREAMDLPRPMSYRRLPRLNV